MSLSTALVLSRHDGTMPSESSREMITAGAMLADRVVVATFDTPPAEQFAAFGATEILACDTGELGDINTDDAGVWAALAVAAAKQVDPDVIILGSTHLGKEIAAQIGMMLDSGVVTDADGVAVEDGRLSIEKAVFSGTWATRPTVIRGIPVVALRPTAIKARERAAAEVPVAPISIDVPERSARTRLVKRTRHDGGGAALSEAQVVVCGGRGMDGDFTLAYQLAEKLGGVVGATRVACDEGWIDHSVQIGQTGETVAPTLYIGLGVSGAIHHTTGMAASQNIAVICDDEEAPIFGLADLGVVGDLNTIVPELLELL